MRTILTLVSSALLLTLTACSSGAEDRPSVVASFYPLAFAAERLAGGCVDVRDLTPVGVEPHDLELDPDSAEAIATADLVVYLGGGFQPAVEDAIADAGGQTLDVLEEVPTLTPPPEEAAEGLTVDPHVWLDPSRFAAIVGRIGQEIEASGAASGCDVGGATAELRGELAALDTAFREGLSACEDDLLVTAHAAFAYLADAYGLRQEPITGLEPDSEPDPERLADLTDLVEREGVTTIFTEELVSPEVAETLAAEAGVRTDVLSTLEGRSEEEVEASQDYLTLMRGNLESLRDALRCS